MSVTRFFKSILGPAMDATVPYERPVLSLRQYRSKARGFADELVYGLKLDPFTTMTLDGGYTRTYHYAGADLNAASLEHRNALCDRLNVVFKDYSDGWMFQVDLDRRESTYFPESTWTDRASWLVDEEERARFTHGTHFESDTYITLTYTPPSVGKQKRADLLYIQDDASTRSGFAREAFAEGIRRFEAHFGREFTLTPLGTREADVDGEGPVVLDDQLAFFTMCATAKRQSIRAVAAHAGISDYVASETLVTGNVLQVGSYLFKPVTVLEFPKYSTPALLDVLDQVPHSYRVHWRWIARDYDKALAEIKSIRRLYLQKRKGALDHVVKSPNPLIDPDAENMIVDGEDAFAQIRSRNTHFGWFTLSIVLREKIRAGEPFETAHARLVDGVDALEAALQARHFLVSRDDDNEKEAFIGTLPAHGHANVMRSMLSARNFANFMPTTSVWRGSKTTTDPLLPAGAAPLAVFATNGRTPFYLNLGAGNRGGHTLVVGNTGSGKSSLVGYLANRHRRYGSYPAGAQQIFIDRDYSHFVQCMAVGGSYVSVAPNSEAGFSPLRYIDEDDEFLLAETFLAHIFSVHGLERAAFAEPLFKALVKLRQAPPERRCLFDLAYSFGITNEMRSILQLYTREGIAGSLLDRSEPTVAKSSFTVFEISKLDPKNNLYSIAMMALLHQIMRMCRDGKPTILVGEEFWALLRDEASAMFFDEALRTLRKFGVYVVIVTQSIKDVVGSRYSSIILDSCANRIIMPDESAASETSSAVYADTLGLEMWERRALAEIVGQPAFYFMQGSHRRLLLNEMGPVARNTVAVTSVSEREKVQTLQGEFAQDWYPELIARRAGEGWRKHYYYGPQRTAETAGAVAPSHLDLHPSDPLSKGSTYAA
jgi:type IV secretion system protein VirB4